MNTLDWIMLAFVTIVAVGSGIGFFIYNNKEEDR